MIRAILTRPLYRVGPIYCTEMLGDAAISYQVDDVADWEKRRRAEYAVNFELLPKNRMVLWTLRIDAPLLWHWPPNPFAPPITGYYVVLPNALVARRICLPP